MFGSSQRISGYLSPKGPSMPADGGTLSTEDGIPVAPEILRYALSRMAWRTRLCRAWPATSKKRCG